MSKIKWNPAKWGKRVVDSKNNHWQEIDLKHYRRTKPIVVCLGGNATLTPEKANGFCKRAQRQLELLITMDGKPELPVDIIGCTYGYTVKYDIPQMDEGEMGKFFKKYPTPKDFAKDYPDKVKASRMGYLNDEEIDDFVSNIMMPMCFDKKGKAYPIDEACKNLSQITFFTWCHGDREVYQIFNRLSLRCAERGVSTEDIYKLFSSCMHVTYAPITRANMIPTICIDSLADSNNLDYSEEYANLDGVEIKYVYSDPQKKAFFDKIQVLTSKLTNETDFDIDEHSIVYLDRDEMWDIKHGHANADCVSQIMCWALCSAVENGLKNSKSDTYINTTPMLKVYEDLKYVKESFGEDQLKRM